MNKFKEKIFTSFQTDIFWQNVSIVCLCLYVFWSIVLNVSMVSDNVKNILDKYPLIPVVGFAFSSRIYLRKGKKWLIPSILIFVIIFLCSFLAPDRCVQLLIPVIFSFGLYNVNYKKILKPVIVAAFGTLFLIVVLSRCGLAENLVYVSQTSLRLSFGSIYPTDFAALIFYLVVISLSVAYTIPNPVCSAICLGGGVTVYYFQRGTCSALCFFITAFGYLYYAVTEDGILKNTKVKKYFNKFIGWMEQYLFIILTCLTVVLAIFYGTNEKWAIIANDKLHSRLYFSFKALKEYGLSLFGNPDFEQIGYGSSTFSRKDYFFIDSSYMYILIYYGFAVLAIIGFYYYVHMKNICRGKNYRVALALAVIAIHSFEEQHFIEPWYNILSCLILADYSNVRPLKKINHIPITTINVKERFNSFYNKILAGLRNTKKRNFILIGVLVIISLFEILFGLPKLFSYIRVMTGVNGYTDLDSSCLIPKNKIFSNNFIFIFVLAFLSAIILFFVFIYKYIKKQKKSYAVCGSIFLIIFLNLQIGLSVLVINYKQYYKSETEEDSVILNKLFTEDDCNYGKVYVDSAACFYGNNSQYLSDSFLFDTELAKKHNITYFCDASVEKRAFTVNDFAMFICGENRIIYTNSEAVTEKLTSLGYERFNYFPFEYSLISESDGIILTEDKSFISEKIFTPDGKYKLNILFDLSEAENCSEETVICSYYLPDCSDAEKIDIRFGDLSNGAYNAIIYCNGTGNTELDIYAGTCDGVRIEDASLNLVYFSKYSDKNLKFSDTVPLLEVLRMIKIHW